ncbi:hypothetical protein OZX60_03830 [Streptococcaceae bacterium ESL0687]|nr:hypothetical protein OZX60_03830 [Streptococcaceae bacterium ESL0687]
MDLIKKMSYTHKSLLISFIYYAVSGLGMAMSIKADIGVTCFNALLLSLSDILSIKVGTMSMLANISFLVLCFLLDRNKNMYQYLLMFVAQFCFGSVVNFFLYNLLGNLVLTNYFLKLGLFFLGLVVTCFGVGRILYYKILQFPIENFCNLLAARTNHSMKFYRYGIDVFGVSGSLILSFAFNLPIYVREGTIISLFLFSHIMSWSYGLKGISKK